jgi:hypothetical protein
LFPVIGTLFSRSHIKNVCSFWGLGN